ncbi:MAG: histidine kinase [Lachnospiraceae bacterium]|nr:histidine kinase [Lachnospiraceae bacterium]
MEEQRRDFSIRQQIFAAMVLVSVLSVTILGSILYYNSRKTIEHEYQTAHENSLQVASNIIEISLNNMISKARSFLTDREFKGLLANEKRGSTEFLYVVNQQLTEVLNSYISGENALRDICVVNMEGNICFASQNDKNRAKIASYYTTGDLPEQDFIAAAREEQGKEIFYGYNVLFEDAEGYESFSLVKELIDPDTMEPMGYLIMNIKKRILDDAFGTKSEGYSTNRYLILDRQDVGNRRQKPVYISNIGSELEERVILEDYFRETSSGDYIYTTYTNAVSGWEMVNVIAREELAEKSTYIGLLSVLVSLILVAASSYVSSLIATRITRPLNVLEDNIKAVAEGNYKIEADFDDSEIGRIGNQFKNMVNNNLELENRLLNSKISEREAQLLLLQSQINPHFLYNTLDALYFMAVIHNDDEIAELVQALSDTFKLSLNQGDKMIRVCDEIHHIQAYMKIQQFRYRDRFTLELNIDPKIEQQQMLALLLQPLVENSVYHGLESRAGEGKIIVSGYQEGDGMTFSVEDNGIGMEDITVINRGYGVRNIRERIRLFYGEQYDLQCTSIPGKGTKMVIHIPMREGELS